MLIHIVLWMCEYIKISTGLRENLQICLTDGTRNIPTFIAYFAVEILRKTLWRFITVRCHDILKYDHVFPSLWQSVKFITLVRISVLSNWSFEASVERGFHNRSTQKLRIRMWKGWKLLWETFLFQNSLVLTLNWNFV